MTEASLSIHHCTSLPFRFFGRSAELAVLDRALVAEKPSLVAFIGTGGQGKTAIVQHWLEQFTGGNAGQIDGLFLWSFYRGKDVDLCLREIYAFVAGFDTVPDVSATYCVDRALPLLRQKRCVVVLDGTEVVQYERGPWTGRFVHPELGRLLEEVASGPLPGVMVLTTRFSLPELERRSHAHVIRLTSLDADSSRRLLRTLQVQGTDAELEEVAAFCGGHAKAVELLGTYLTRFHAGVARAHKTVPESEVLPGMSDEEQKVNRVLQAFQTALTAEAKDVLALATAFREPATEARLLDYLASAPVHALLHDKWQRGYRPFRDLDPRSMTLVIDELVALRLLERVRTIPGEGHGTAVIDAHPLVRRAFDDVLGTLGRRQSAQARAGFLEGRPDRRRAASLEEAREDVEMFHAYCDGSLWDEANLTLLALDRPAYRFLAPALERELLLRFFPEGNWRQPPLWPGFNHYRRLAICFELQGSFEEAIDIYRDVDAPLRGDALIALGRLEVLLEKRRAPHPWQMLWGAYQAHAWCLAGRTNEAVTLAAGLVPVDVYEWTHIFECLLRAGQLRAIDMASFLYRPPNTADHRWNDLARQRMRADYLRVTADPSPAALGDIYSELLEAYDRGGLPYERALTRLSYARWFLARLKGAEAQKVTAAAVELAQRHRMSIVEADAQELAAAICNQNGQHFEAAAAIAVAQKLRRQIGYLGPRRP